jgi:hypothetical protein
MGVKRDFPSAVTKSENYNAEIHAELFCLQRASRLGAFGFRNKASRSPAPAPTQNPPISTQCPARPRQYNRDADPDVIELSCDEMI